MPLLPTFRTLLAAAGLALTLGGAGWAQDAVEEPVLEGEELTPAEAVEAVTEDMNIDEPVVATDDGVAPLDAVTVTPEEVIEGGTPDASGNMAGDAAPSADPVDAATVDGPVVGEALPIIGQPVPNGVNFQPSVTQVAQNTRWLDSMVNWIILVITLFVTALLLWVIYRFNERRNPKPAGFTHNSPLEITWTVVPIVILVFIGAFSLPVLFNQQEIPEGDVHITVTGRQWFWSYEYPDEGIAFDSYMIGYNEGNLSPEISEQLAAKGFSDEQFKLATDNAVVVPVGATVVVTVTGGDVIHSWKVPAFGVMQDAVPGRLAQLWFNAEVEGIYFGQCSELCGKDHAFMPIEVRVVSPEAYEAWVAEAQVEFPAG